MKVILHPDFNKDKFRGFVVVDEHGTYLQDGFTSEIEAYEYLISFISNELLTLKNNQITKNSSRIEKLEVLKDILKDRLSRLTNENGPS
ncbi:hypothetical protein [Type-D symbiont of Plautia stali]|uniref:hypothetical protein n=1 Tax=Type-D symbiont of Plautia stali TaxID=1560356 RepID=UPI00128F8874|nr:hypothetical protein [Type-D symbiont of Plautia stali]